MRDVTVYRNVQKRVEFVSDQPQGTKRGNLFAVHRIDKWCNGRGLNLELDDDMKLRDTVEIQDFFVAVQLHVVA